MNVAKIGKDLMIREPFYGLYLLNLNKVVTDTIPTLAVGLDGINTVLYINEKCWENLNDTERIAVLQHELMHICLQHITTTWDMLPDKKLRNIAMDLEINQLINGLPKWVVTLDSFPKIELPKRAGTITYYKLLSENLNSDNPDPNLQQLMGQMGGRGNKPMTWEEFEKAVKEGNIIVDHMTWEEFDKLSNAEKELVKSQSEFIMKECANQVNKSRGIIPGELKDIIDELFRVKEQIYNWKAYFRRLMGNSFNIFTKKTLRKESDRFEGNAGIKIKKKHNILVARDTSGSVSNEELLEFESEIYHIYKTGAAITVIDADTTIQKIYEYKGKFTGEVHGRGGTDFEPVIDHYNENLHKYTTLIYFTDGYAPTNNLHPKRNMVWVISSNGDKNGKYPGYVINIPENRNN